MAKVEIYKDFFSQPYRAYTNGTFIGELDYSLVPANTPAWFGLNTEVLNQSQNFAQALLTFSGSAINNNDSITIRNREFIAKTNPTESNHFFALNKTPANASQVELQAVIDSLVTAINRDSNLAPFYSASANLTGQPNFTLNAQQQGSFWNLNSTNIQTNIFNVTTLSTSNDLNRGQKLQEFDYGVWLEIWTYVQNFEWGRPNNAINRKLVATLNQKYNGSNTYIFEVSSYLQSLLNFQLPNKGTVNVDKLEGHIYPFFFRYGEEFNGGYDFNTQEPKDSQNKLTLSYTIGESPLYYAAFGTFPLGKTDTVDFFGNPLDPFTDYWRQITIQSNNNQRQPVKPAIQAPSYKLIHRNTNSEYLYFYFLNTQEISQGIVFRTKTIFTGFNGTQDTVTQNIGSNGGSTSGLYVLNADPISAGSVIFESNNNEKVMEYEFIIEFAFAGGNYQKITSQTYRIFPNFTGKLKPKIYWQNDLGTLDSFDFYGKQEEELDIETKEYQQVQGFPTFESDERYFRDTFQNSVLEKNVVTETTFHTPLIDEEHFRYLKGLMVSPNVWTVGKNNQGFQEFESIKVIDFNWEFNSESKKYQVAITFRKSYK
jgi:hypothetical protein